jgi:hypothetical protein
VREYRCSETAATRSTKRVRGHIHSALKSKLVEELISSGRWTWTDDLCCRPSRPFPTAVWAAAQPRWLDPKHLHPPFTNFAFTMPTKASSTTC